jgi:hypothetical protein
VGNEDMTTPTGLPPAPLGAAVLTKVDDLNAASSLGPALRQIAAAPLDASHTESFFDAAEGVAAHYSSVTDERFRSWLDAFFGAVTDTPTCYGKPVAWLAVGRAFARYAVSWASHPRAGVPLWNSFITQWSRPPAPRAWRAQIDAVCAGEHPTEFGGLWGRWQEVIQNVHALLDPAKWTDASSVANRMAEVWKRQSTALTSMRGKGVLDAADCVLLIQLLPLFAISPQAADQQAAMRIASAPVSSDENPNDTLLDQLVYFVLMHLADPRGPFALTHPTILDWCQRLNGSGPASGAFADLMNRVLDPQIKLLITDLSYPNVDPENPATPFRQRYADTLAAINRAWPALR